MHSLAKPTDLNNLNFDDPEQPMEPAKLTNNELIFNWVKEHPACYSSDVVAGFKGRIVDSSVMSQLYTMEKRKLFHKVKCSSTGKYMYSTAVDVYPRASRPDAVAKMWEARNKLGKEEMSRRIAEGHAANKVEEPPKRKVVLIKRRVNPPTEVEAAVQVTPVDLNKLSIVQARKLYDELKQIFGA
jgi:hypothetical protein